MARTRRLTAADLLVHAKHRCTSAQRTKLETYIGAGWSLTKVDGLEGYDAVVCIALQGTPAVIDPNGTVTRPGPGLKSVSYKFPKTTIALTERRSAVAA